MKILFTRFPLESRMGGAEVQTLSLMEGLSAKGHLVSFLGSCPTLLKAIRNSQFAIRNVSIGPPPVTKWGALSFMWKGKTMQKKLIDALDAFGPIDAIFMLSMSEKLLATEWATKRGIKVFWVEHDSVGRWLTKNPWLSNLQKLSEEVTTICVSELSRKKFIALGWKAEQVIAIPNGIDLHRFMGSRPNPSPSPLRIGCVARLSQEKGVDVLIQAVGNLPNMELTIVGTGPDEGYLRKLAMQIHDGEMLDRKRITFVPQVDDLGDFYRSINALVLPSRDNDPFGMVAAEAMALGVPVIVTDACGIADYLTNGSDALIVKANSSKELEDALSKLMDVTFRASLGAAGKRTAEEKFSLESMINAYESLCR